MAIISIIKQVYGESQSKSVIRENTAPNINKSIAIEPSGDYIDHYNRVKEMAKEKNWKQEKINKMLSDRNAFDKEYNLVSFSF
jgi:hypothetical protein